MSTTFPAAIDTFTNPLAIDPLETPNHAQQHADANDAIVALETYVLGLSPGTTGFVNVQDYGATGDGVTDDTADIQSAIDDSDTGDIVLFPGGDYLISSPLVLRGARTYRGAGLGSQAPTITLSNGFSGGGALVARAWDGNFTSTDTGFVVEHLALRGNRGNLGSTVHGIICNHWRSVIRHCDIQEFTGDGVHLTSFTKNGNQLPSGQTAIGITIEQNYIANCDGDGVRIVDTTTNGQQISDGYCLTNKINNVNNGINTRTTAGTATGAVGWVVDKNHLWDIDQNAIHLEGAFRTWVTDNQIESFGESSVNGDYYGIRTGGVGRSVYVSRNAVQSGTEVAGSSYVVVSCEGSAGTTTYYVISDNYIAGGGGALGLRTLTATIRAHVVGNTLDNVGTEVNFANGVINAEANSFQFSTAAPSAGTWRAGIRVWHSAPTSAATPGFICTSGGTPGVWRNMAVLSA